MSEQPTVLVVDDEADIRDVIQEYLTNHGMRILEAENGAAARALLTEHVPQLVLLDINMPGENGLSLARHLREHYDLGIIMVTAAGETIDRVVGLEMGADDYIAKPFDLRELLARTRSVLRRYESPDEAVSISHDKEAQRSLSIGEFELDLDVRCLKDKQGERIELTSMEFDLLCMFAERPNRVMSRDQILNLTQNRDWDPYDRSIDIRVTRLRRKIEKDPARPALIKTVRGIGYIFIPAE
ncbi:MAG: response regulator [Candidatus Thiodiazotropha sp. (ex. Lucinisca nassula)]|nr:response regulator [Candidatus Thiodiazotropha sp. (ex. Lucinisca nassula)]MBW9271476.1 response regulator [Candidatus Thiodiazotropha sp. (ex. Lucinisca nassula)]